MDMSSLSRRTEVDTYELPLEAFPGILELAKSELERFTVHIVDSSTADRASAFRLFSEFGYHCEIYSTLAELVNFQPSSGIVLVHERPGGETVTEALEQTREAGLPLTIAGYAHNPSIDLVITAMQAGARHYFELPFDPQKVGPVLKALTEVNKAQHKSNTLRANALMKLRRLSVREKQVIELMVDGNSNKSIARLLGISPRTVEIHRMKAMGKLGAQNASEAVRIWLIGTDEFRSATQQQV